MATPDYSDYSFRELYEALGALRGDLYPQVLQALEDEIAKRQGLNKAELEEIYFRLDTERFPRHAERLRQEIARQGGFESIAPEVVTEQNRFSTGWRRFWAVIFDAIILFAVMAPVAMLVEEGRNDNLALMAALDYGTTLVTIFYYILLHAAWGQTLGKMITGVKVVKNSDLSPIAFRHALTRDMVPLLVFIVGIVLINYLDIGIAENKQASLQPPPIVGAVVFLQFLWPLLELITMLFNRRRRAIHDFIAGTVVIRYLRHPAHPQDRQPATSVAAT